MPIDSKTGKEVKKTEQDVFTTPGGVNFNVAPNPETAREIGAGLFDGITLPKSTVATKDSPIVSRGTTDTTVVNMPTANTENVVTGTDNTGAIDGRVTNLTTVLSEEERRSLADAELKRIREMTDISFEDRNKLFQETRDKINNGDFFGGETQLDIQRRQAEAEKLRIQGQAGDAVKEAQDIFAQDLQREVTRIREQGQRVMDTTQRLNSLRGGGRSSANETVINEQQSQVNQLISAAERKSDLELQKRKLEIEGAESGAINGITEQLAANEKLLNARISEATKTQATLDAQLGATFGESSANLVGLLAASGVEVGDYDEKATEALGYISDSKGIPLKIDKDGNPVAPKNKFGMDAKISNFKDANDNTYVYTNGELTSIITTEGNILKGDQLNTVKVPAQVEEDKTVQQRRDSETSLRNEFIKRPEVKRFQEIRAQFERVKQGADANNASGDIALVFSFMKMLDPGSVVRESEFATAQNAAGVPDQVRNLYNKAISGTRLGADQRQEFKRTAENLLKSEVENFKTVKDGFTSIIEDAGARPDFVIIGDEFDTGENTSNQFNDEENSQLNSIFGEEQTTTQTTQPTFETTSGFKFDFNIPDQTGGTKDVSVTPGTTKNRPDRNNNPGNVKLSPINESISTQTDDQGHLIFKTPEEGFKALQNDLFAKLDGRTRNESLKAKVLNKTATLEDLGRAYAEDPNWGVGVARILGINSKTKLQDIDRTDLLKAIPIQEGFTGKINS